jgi:hypothetical protein
VCDNNAELIDDVTFNGSIAFATYGSNAGVLVVPILASAPLYYIESWRVALYCVLIHSLLLLVLLCFASSFRVDGRRVDRLCIDDECGAERETRRQIYIFIDL